MANCKAVSQTKFVLTTFPVLQKLTQYQQTIHGARPNAPENLIILPIVLLRY